MEGDGAVLLDAEVLVGAELAQESNRQLVEGLRSLGIDPTVKQVLRHRGASDILPWLVLIALPLQPFFNSLLERLAGDAYPRLKAFVVRLFHSQSGAGGDARVLVLQDTASGVQVVLEPDLPAESYERLHRIDLATLGPGPLRYDRTTCEWRSPLDESVQLGVTSR